MDIFFKTRKLAKVFNSERELRKQYGDRVARTIALRLAVLKHARTLAMVPATPPDRRHCLAGKRKEQYAVDLVHPTGSFSSHGAVPSAPATRRTATPAV